MHTAVAPAYVPPLLQQFWLQCATVVVTSSHSSFTSGRTTVYIWKDYLLADRGVGNLTQTNERGQVQTRRNKLCSMSNGHVTIHNQDHDECDDGRTLHVPKPSISLCLGKESALQEIFHGAASAATEATTSRLYEGSMKAL